MKKKFFYGIILISLLVIGVFGTSLCLSHKELTIDEILETKAYSYLSPRVKEYIKEYYEETGKVLLTKEIAKEGETYLNPSYIEYLDSDKKEEYTVVPTSVAYNPKLATSTVNYPSSYDLRSVDGKNFVTPNKNQGSEGLCWAYATASLLETHDLISKNKSYDSSAIRLSEKQLDYALSSNGILGGNKISNKSRVLSDGGALDYPETLLMGRLTAYQDTWNTENSSVINNNGQLEPNIVFNRSKALFELDESMRLTNINGDLSNTELNEAMIDVIKGIIVNYGGATVNIKTSNSNTIRNILNGNDYLTITSLNYYTMSSNQHALHLIGWDDDYEYGFCSGDSGGQYGKFVSDSALYHADHSCGKWGSVEQSYDYVKVTGRGAWLLKNSWGDSYQYIHLPYDSFIDDIFTITEYSDKNWDDSNKLTQKYIGKGVYHYGLDNEMFDGDAIVKLKLTINGPEEVPLYYSEDGSSSTLIGTYNFDYAGVKTIDLSDRNLHINKDSYFEINASYQMMVFTNKSNNNMDARTTDFTYDITNDAPTNIKYLNIGVTTNLKNINESETINYKIKNSSGEYIPTTAYIETINKSYNSMVTPIIKLSEEYAKKGEYSLETWKDDNLLYTSSINLDVDYESIDGDGSQNNPWQIKNARHFNMVRNALSDNYILMNDIDFEYDTQNPNGIFYNDGEGWSSISYFVGNFDGNNKTLKNIKTSDGIFGYIWGYNTKCNYEECGIHDLKVDNLKYNVTNHGQSSGNGGIINVVSVLSYKYRFDNLSLTNAEFIYDEYNTSKSNTEVRIGGIFGELTVYGNNYSWDRAIVKLDNLYSNYTVNMTAYDTYKTTNYIGGLIGETNLYFNPYLYINNAKVNASININNDDDTTVYVSDLIGAYDNDEGIPTFIINNTIAIIDYQHNDNSGIYSNAFIGGVGLNAQGVVKVNGARTTFDYIPNSIINLTNSLTSAKPYEIARSNYNGIEYYDSQYDSYSEYYDGTTKIEFKDKYNVYGDKIPTLKKYPENYSEYYKNYTIGINEEKSITDLISNDTNYRDMHVYKSFECDLDICNNVTDETIISVPTEANGYKFKGLKSGITTLIIYDKLSGYLDTVTIRVLAEGEHILSLDYNYDSIVDNNHIVKENTTYGTLPTLERDGYTFLGWFTDSSDGEIVNADNMYTGNTNITLYAHWEIKSYTVTFNANGGTSVISQTINYNGKAEEPTVPTKTGYTFKGWKLNGNIYNFNTPVTDNINLLAEWEINHYTVTFNTNGGTSIINQTIDYNKTASKPANPTRGGYTFKEWQLNGSTYDFNTPVTDNITLNAVWDKNEEENTLSETLQSNSYTITNNIVSGFTVGKTIQEIKTQLGNDVTIETQNTVISTGAVIRKNNESFTVVVKGDLTGDGRINSGDLLQMRKHLLEEVNLEGAYKQAGILESNGNIKSLDLLRLRQYLLGEYTIR